MSWGVSPDATNKEKLKADFLNGLNSTGALGAFKYESSPTKTIKNVRQQSYK
ncbi:hypothetical protein [Bacillus velezensis]|uniref:hypothetical protein n=1 Tax=Bacillus velezensis TaxID=492670 RepID=UPI002892F1DA|nr:hypothetical protein [Bacillus velezensis]WNJ75562.1 hypothetical protein RNI18_00940 [Bacillus velezensis]